MDIGPPTELTAQLVVEVECADLARSLAFYEALGFTVARRAADFAALRWGDAYLFLTRHRGLPELVGPSRANVRVIVDDADAVWARAQALGATVERAIGDRSYGLRDFTIVDPDGFALRFAAARST